MIITAAVAVVDPDALLRDLRGRMQEAVRRAPAPVRCVVLDAEAVTHIDSTGLDFLAQAARDLRAAGIELLVAR